MTVVQLQKTGELRINDYPDGPLNCSYEFVGHDILVVENAVPFAKDLVETADKLALWGKSPLIRGVSTQYYDDDMRNNSKCDIRADVHPDLAQFEKKLIYVFHGAVKLYMMDNSYISVTRDEGYQLLKYNVGEHFKPHIDLISGRSGAEGMRAVSAVAYLNDDYEGGDLYFPRQGFSVKPNKGSIVLFPSNFTHIHESRDVTRGTKYSVVTWFS